MTLDQGLREGGETDAEHRGPRCLGKIRGPPLYRKKKIWLQNLVCFTLTGKYTYLQLSLHIKVKLILKL